MTILIKQAIVTQNHSIYFLNIPLGILSDFLVLIYWKIYIYVDFFFFTKHHCHPHCLHYCSV